MNTDTDTDTATTTYHAVHIDRYDDGPSWLIEDQDGERVYHVYYGTEAAAQSAAVDATRSAARLAANRAAEDARLTASMGSRTCYSCGAPTTDSDSYCGC